MSKKNQIKASLWGLLNRASLQAFLWGGIVLGFGATAEASCDFLLNQKVLLGFEKSAYRTMLLAKTLDDEPYYVIGSVTDSHDDLQLAIEETYGEVKDILLPGEAGGEPAGITLTNDFAGIHKRKPHLTQNSSLEHLKAAIKHNPTLQSIYSNKALFSAYAQNPTHLHPALNFISSFRHDFNGYMSPVVMNLYFQDEAIQFDDQDELRTVTATLSEQAKKLSSMMLALQQMNVPQEGHLPEIYEFHGLLGRLVHQQVFTKEEKLHFISLSKKMGSRNPSPILTIIPLNRWY